MTVGDVSDQAAYLQREWDTGPRWAGIQRDYRAEDVLRHRGPVAADHAPARSGAQRLWELLGDGDAVRALGPITGDHAVQLMRARSQAVQLSGWPVPAGGAPDPFQLMTAMIGAGAAGAVFDDRRPATTGGDDPGARVLVPTGEHIETLAAARLAADVLDVPALVIARTFAHETSMLTSDADERDHEFLTGGRTADGHHLMAPGMYARVTRALAFAPYADLLWLETAAPNLAEARAFADIVYSQHPGQLLAYGCAPAFDWTGQDQASIAQFQAELTALGYRFQFTATAAPAESEQEAQFAA